MDKQAPTVVVITRTKNRPELLERALLSVMQQTFNDLQMVIVNDGGDPEPIKKLLAKHKELIAGRARLITNKTSVGMQAASNIGIKDSKSKYVIIHDDDDSWHKDFLALSLESLKTCDKNTRGVIVPTDIIVEEIAGDTIKKLDQKRLYPGLKSIGLYKMCLENYAAPISFLFERAVFKDIGYYDESLGGVGDWDFGLRFVSKYDIHYLDLDYALAYYHHRPTANGVNANSVYTDSHRSAEEQIANKYLREDLAKGSLGLGYIINSLRYSHELLHANRVDLQSQTKHIEMLAAGLDARIQKLDETLQTRTSLFEKASPRKAAGKIKRRIANN